ncbi:MAG: four helix bundle protein [Patescibacteria group bacterium]
MAFDKFENIIAWQRSRELVREIYRHSSDLKDFGYRDQIQRASVSIMNNIAEGFERKGNKEFKKFLYIAKGSCAEVRSMIYLALDFSYIDQKEFKMLYDLTVEISKMLSGILRTLE